MKSKKKLTRLLVKQFNQFMIILCCVCWKRIQSISRVYFNSDEYLFPRQAAINVDFNSLPTSLYFPSVFPVATRCSVVLFHAMWHSVFTYLSWNPRSVKTLQEDVTLTYPRQRQVSAPFNYKKLLMVAPVNIPMCERHLETRTSNCVCMSTCLTTHNKTP